MKTLLLTCLLALAAPVAAQVVPNAPIVNFRLPMFNELGYKTWEVNGREGRYINENRVEITSLELKVFTGDASGAIETEITSPLAIVQPGDRVVSGPGQLRVVGRGFEIFGDDWTYEDAGKKLTLRRSVVVTLRSGVGSILK